MRRKPFIIYCDTRRDPSVQSHPWRLTLPGGILCAETVMEVAEAWKVFDKHQEPTTENIEAWVAQHEGLRWIPGDE